MLFRRTTILPGLAAAATLLTLAACSSYRLGPPPGPNLTSLGLAPVRVETFLPQAGPVFEQALRTTLATDPRWTWADTDQSQAVLEVTLTDFRRATAASRPDDAGRVFAYRWHLSARARVRDRQGAILARQDNLSVELPMVAGDNSAQAESEALPALARELARKIRDGLLTTW